MSKKRFVLAFLLGIAMSAHGQLRYRQGYFVNNAGDTVRGFIGVTESDLSPAEVRFKASLEDEPKNYQLEDVQYFSIEGVGAYQRFNVSVSMDPVDLNRVQGYRPNPPERKTVFLKMLQRGAIINLYAYRDEVKLRFFITDSLTAEPHELVYKVLKVGANFAEAFAFRDMLTFIAERAGIMTHKLKSHINRTEYSQRQILKIVSEINGIEEEKVRVTNPLSTGFTVGAGLEVAWLHYYGNDEYVRNAKGSSSSLYWFSVGYDLAKNPYVGKLVFRGDLTVSVAKLSTTTYDYRYSSELDIAHSFTQRTLGVGGYGLYNLRNEEKYKLFFSAGVRANFSFYDNHYELRRTSAGSVDIIPNKDAEPRRIWVSIPLKVGVIIRSKVEVGAAYSPSMVLSHGDFPYKYGISSVQVGVLYHFLTK